MAELTKKHGDYSRDSLLFEQLRTAGESIDPAIRTEVVRKSIHLLVALVPTVAALFGSAVTISLLASGTVFYTVAELSRQNGHTIMFVSRVTTLSTRERDRGHFVLGPVTLGLGAMLAMFLYPAPVAAIAIYALAFGDGLSSLVGKMAGRISLFGGVKTLEGSLACFAAVFAASAGLVARPEQAFVIAFAATTLEALPSHDFDNLILPLGTGFVASAVLAVM
ncbi:MAG: diacylglycerol/polyprenol kinase family protein [bacterium]